MAEGQNKNANVQEQDINQLLKVRREKLANLQAAGKDPFQITKYDVTHHTAEARMQYEAHEAELLAGREAVNVEGLDEVAAREAANADYNERRAIMDASPINVSIAGRMMFKRVMGKASFCNIQDLEEESRYMLQKMLSVKMLTQILRNLILAIFTVLRAMCSVQRPAKFPYMQ